MDSLAEAALWRFYTVLSGFFSLGYRFLCGKGISVAKHGVA